MKIKIVLAAVILGQHGLMAQEAVYRPEFASLEQANPAPEWFKDAKFGIYFHWGVYSVPAFANEWYPRNMYIQGSAENRHHVEVYGEPSEWPYPDFITGAEDRQGRFTQFAPQLKSEGGRFDPDEWAQLFADSGARFAGPVAEHHDGFSMWASEVNPWNAADMGPKLDLVGLLTEAIRKKDLKIILSMHHAYNITGYYEAVPQSEDPLLRILYGQQGKEQNEALWLSKHKEIIDRYHPDIIWQDFNLHLISRPVLLEFLAYYYNQAEGWGREVVATYKDGLNTECAVLDYERGGPADITENYWLTDDAISSSSWCYTEGLEYYSTKQILHGFLDRISKNGNLLLNISPMADGTIPPEQKEILLTMGAWLDKYGEAVYATRAWERYGEGPTKMGSGHGVMGAPAEGTAADVRYTRSKDNTTLYAILLGWDEGQDRVVLSALSSDRINLNRLQSVQLISGAAGEYLPLTFHQDAAGLSVELPDRSFEELAYVLKLTFADGIPPLDRYVDLNCAPYYYLVPEGESDDRVLHMDMRMVQREKTVENQWKFECIGKGIYTIANRTDRSFELEYNTVSQSIGRTMANGKDGQYWKVEEGIGGWVTLSNLEHPEIRLSLDEDSGRAVAAVDAGSAARWKLVEVCGLEQKPFKPHTIPGSIEFEDFDSGCPDEAFHDTDEVNEGGGYRQTTGVDIETCSAGGYNVGWTRSGEWLAYSVTVSESASYRISFHVAAASDTPKIHLECDGEDITGILDVPNTVGYQNWEVMQATVKLAAGQHVLRLVIDGDYVNLDKMDFEKVEL